MKIINHIMIVCVLAALQVHGSGVQLSDESVADVFRVRHKSELEPFKTKLRQVLKQRCAIQDRLEGLATEAKFFDSSNLENADLIGDIGLTFDQRFVDSMGEKYSQVNAAVYKDSRDELTVALCALRDFCFRGRSYTETPAVRALMSVDKFLNRADLGVRALDIERPDPHDLMSRWENFLEEIKGIQCLLKTHSISILECTVSLKSINQDEVRGQPRSELSRLCDKSVLRENISEYRSCQVACLTKKMCGLLNVFEKSFEQERSFRIRENPLVLLQEESSKLTLEERRDNVRENLDKFIQMEREISARLKRLAGCAHFFIRYDFAQDVRRFPQLGVAHADWYEKVVKKQVSEFLDAEKFTAGYGPDLLDILRVLHERDDCIVFPPIQVTCDFQENDLCGNLDIFIKILEEVQDLEESQSRQQESLQRSVFGVLCDQTAQATLEYQFPYIEILKSRRLGNLISDQNKRREMIDKHLLAFSDFLKIKEYMVAPKPEPVSLLSRLMFWSAKK
ncbi:MAG: hypothetical protein OXC30_00460 [Alphaproteobacteria bacterium]|nr:hypothetical protein [Alphaproteobacteria bacterium]